LDYNGGSCMINDKSIVNALELINHEFASMEGYIVTLENAIDTLEIQLEQEYQENRQLKMEIASLKENLLKVSNALVEAHLTDSR
jgi:regulator of replication initiation timing